jgi:type I restriction enzyme, S subunit
MSWYSYSIDEITQVVTKGTTPTTLGRQFTDSGVNFVKAEALNGDSGLDIGGIFHIDEDTHEMLARSVLQEHDVLVTIAGAQVGRCGYVKTEHLPANTNQAVGIVRINKDKAVPRFVYYFFKQPSTFAFCQSLGGQAAQPNVNLTVLKSIRVPLPSLGIQTTIASVLSVYDDLIENNQRRMALLEEAARQLYREWFVRLRFPDHEHTRVINGVPDGWENTTAISAMDVLSGGTPKTSIPDYWDGDIPFYTPKDASEACYVLETERSITELGIKNCNSRLYAFDTVFISARGTVGKLNLVLQPMAMSQSCYALIGKGYVSQLFLFCALKEAIEHFKQHAVGAVFDAIVVDTFKLIPFVVPDEKTLRLFEETVTPMFRQVANLMEQNQKLRAARDLLLPRLMNGQVRL